VNSPEDGPVGPKHVEIRRYKNKSEIVTSVGLSFHISFKVAANLRYLGITLTDLNCIHREIKNRFNCGMSATVRSGIFSRVFCCSKM
jgi:hypothetical protein